MYGKLIIDRPTIDKLYPMGEDDRLLMELTDGNAEHIFEELPINILSEATTVAEKTQKELYQKDPKIDLALSEGEVRRYVVDALKKEGIWDKYPHAAGLILGIITLNIMEALDQMFGGKENLIK